MGLGVEKEPLLKRMPNSGGELDEEDEDCTLLTLLKRPRHGKKRGVAVKKDGDAEGFGDTLACFRKKLKTPKMAKRTEVVVKASEDLEDEGKKGDSSTLADEVLGDMAGESVWSEKSQKARRRRSEHGKHCKRDVDGDLGDSLVALMRKAKLSSVDRKKRKKKVSSLLGSSNELLQRDSGFVTDEWETSLSVENAVLQEVEDCEPSTSNGLEAFGDVPPGMGGCETSISDRLDVCGDLGKKLSINVDIIGDEIIEERQHDIVCKEITSMSWEEQPRDSEPLVLPSWEEESPHSLPSGGREPPPDLPSMGSGSPHDLPIGDSQPGDRDMAVSLDESSIVTKHGCELPVRHDYVRFGRESGEVEEAIWQDGYSGQHGEEDLKGAASSNMKSSTLEVELLDGASRRPGEGSFHGSPLMSQALDEDLYKSLDKGLDAQPTADPDHSFLVTDARELLDTVELPVVRVVDICTDLVQPAIGAFSNASPELAQKCNIASTSGCTVEHTSLEDTNIDCYIGRTLSHGHDGFTFTKEIAKEEVGKDREFDIQSTSSNSKDMEMIVPTSKFNVYNEEKQKHQLTRETRNAKKPRHGDMAYEGDLDWENLVLDRVTSENPILTDGERSARTRIKSGSQASAATNEHNGWTSAVAAGLKARSAGPIERIKFKDLLKRKGGLQEYLECRNFIFGLWNKDVRHILTLDDCGVMITPSDVELPRSSLIREIYLFLDSNGYINTGVASNRNSQNFTEHLKEPPIGNSSDKTFGASGFKESDLVIPCEEILHRRTGAPNLVESTGDMENLKAQVKHESFHEAITYICKKQTDVSPKAETKLPDRNDHYEDDEKAALSMPCNIVLEKQELNCKTAVHGECSASDIIDIDIHLNSDHPTVRIEDTSSFNHSFDSKTKSNSHFSVIDHDCKSVAESCKKIIVIGAGPAGLTAARHLQRQGFCVTVLEARDRIGGRVYTDRTSLSVPVDLGASIITGVEADIAAERRPDPSSLICSQLGLELTLLDSDCPLYDVVTGSKVPEDLDKALEGEYNNLLDDVVVLNSKRRDSLSLEEGLEYALKKLHLAHSTSGSEVPIKPEIIESEQLHCSNSLSINKETMGADKWKDNRGSTEEKAETSYDECEDVLSPLERRVMDWHFAHLEYGCAAPLKDVSLLHWNQDDIYGGFGGPHCMIKGGFGNVVESLGDGIHIHLNNVVTEITYSSDCIRGGSHCHEVKVTTSSGKQFVGDAVLITIPLGCLKANTVKFSPALPDWKLSAIQRLGFGVLNKVVLEFPEAFWDNAVDYFGATAEETGKRGHCFMFWNVMKTVGAPVLIALVAGKAAVLGQNWSASVHVNHALLVLRKIFGENSVPDPVASIVTSWEKDPFTRGAYSYVAVGSSGEDYDILGKPVANCLFFAGEATCKEHPDTVGGAMLSGLREAVRIIDIFNTGNDYTAEVQSLEAVQRQVKTERNEVKDFMKRLESYKSLNVTPKSFLNENNSLLAREALLKDMFGNAKTTSGRLHLAKELLRLPVERLKSFAGTKEGLSVLNSWILDSLGKDATQLLRHSVRLLVLVSTDLLAVRLSGIGKTVKDKVCVHTSRDIRTIASQLVNVWIEVLRKEKASNRVLKSSRKPAASDISKDRYKGQRSAKPHLNKCDELKENEALLSSFRKDEVRKGNTDLKVGMNREVKTSCSDNARLEMESKEIDIKSAAKAARAAAVAAAEAYASSEADCNAFRELPKIPSFHKFAKREQYPEMDDFNFRMKKWLSGTLGRQDCLSEVDSRNFRVRDWSVDFSAVNTNANYSKNSSENISNWDCSNDVGVSHSFVEHSGESGVANGRVRKAWVDTDGVGSGGVKDYTAIERWQFEAMDADAELLYTMNLRDEEDSNKPMSKYQNVHNGSCASQATESASLSEGHLKVHDVSCASQPGGMEHIKQAVIDYVASLLMPLYKTRKIDKEGYKSIMKKSITKVVDQCTEGEKVMAVPEFLDFRRKNKIRAFVDKLIERQMAMNQQNVKL